MILDKAILREDMDDDMDVPEIVDLDKILGHSLLVVVPPKAGVHKKGDVVVAMYRATQPDAQWELKGTFEESFGVLLPCVMKLAKAEVISGSKVQVTYQLKRGLEIIGDSRVAKADVIGGTVGDDKPVISLITGSPSGEDIPDGGNTVETAVTLTGVAKKGEKVEVISGSVSHGKPDVDGVTGIWTLLIPALDETTYVFVAKELYGAGQSSDAYTINVVAMQPPVLLAPAVNPIDVLAYEQGVTLRVAFAQALPGQQAQLKERDPLPGSEPFPVLALDPGKQADFALGSAFLVARRGSNRRFYWTLISGGKPIGDSPDLVLVINAIAENDPRLPKPNIAGETGEVLETNELESGARILSAKWPLQKPGQPLWITCEGSDKNGNPVTEAVRSGEPNDSATGLSVTAPVDWLKALMDGTDLQIRCFVGLDGSADKNAAVPLPLRTYKISAFVEIRPTITGVKDSIREKIAEGGTTADSAVTLSGTASAGQNIQLYDGASSIGPVITVQTSGDWSQIIDGLILRTYSFTAIAKYGSGLVSAPPRTLKVVDYVEENFDDLPDHTVNYQEQFETPAITIENIGNPIVIGAHNQLFPGKIEGKVLKGSTYTLGRFNIRLKPTYRRISFWIAQSPATSSVTISLHMNQTLITTKQLPQSLTQTVQLCDIPASASFNSITFFFAGGTVTNYQIDYIRLYK